MKRMTRQAATSVKDSYCTMFLLPSDRKATYRRLSSDCASKVFLSQPNKSNRFISWPNGALGNPKVKDWYSGEWELYNECSIIYTDDEGIMQTRRPDRVMMKDGQVIVVDFKFGKPKDGYRQQVSEYMDLLSAMGYEQIKGYLWYVFANELEEVK